MDFKTLRTIHLYLGCIFTPLLLFFVISGTFQTFGLHASKKNGYRAPLTLRTAAEIHQHQRVWAQEEIPQSKGFQLFVVLMALGFIGTSLLGIAMALKFARPVIVWGCLVTGAVVPALLLKFF